jgi:hypothetical protein
MNSIEEITSDAINDLRGRLQINQFDLENECVNQPELYDEVGQLATEAKSFARSAKDNLDYTRAMVESEIRKNPESFGVVKVTESSVDAAVTIDQRYVDASRKYIDAQRLSDSLSVLQSAAEQRKSMIKDLVSLYIYSYYQKQQSADMGGERKNVESSTVDEIVAKRREMASQRRGLLSEDEEIPNERE